MLIKRLESDVWHSFYEIITLCLLDTTLNRDVNYGNKKYT